jgi:hypothetical protein
MLLQHLLGGKRVATALTNELTLVGLVVHMVLAVFGSFEFSWGVTALARVFLCSELIS